jgi:hypothetical protein
MNPTGEPFLDDTMREFKRLGNIDVFNNAVAWAFDTSTWRDMMRHKHEMLAKQQLPPDIICDEIYATSPLAAVMRKLTKERAELHLSGNATESASASS